MGAGALALAAHTAAAQETIRIGTEGAYPPWNFTSPDGELVGFEIELGNALCERMGVECEWVAQDWDGIIPALLQGRYDAIMAGMSRTEERRETIAFSYGYAETGASFIAPADSALQELETVDDIVEALDGRTVGVQVATIHQNFMEQSVPGAELRFYDTQDLLNLDLAAGRVDAGLADHPAWLEFLETEEGDGFAVFGPLIRGTDYPVFGEGVGVGLRQEDDELRERFNEAICAMAEDGSLEALAVEWFGYDTAMPCPN
jgi:octopine/nopaline transport system substrate-binding protein